MDFDDIIRILIYILIPVFLAARRRSPNRSRRTRNNDAAQPSPKASGRGLMGRLESMVSEMEKAVGESTGKKPPRTTRTPARPEQMQYAGREDRNSREVDWQDVYYEGDTPINQVDIQEVYTSKASQQDQPKRVKKAEKKEKAFVVEDLDQSYQAVGLGDFGSEDILKGIILSEILQPPVSKRQYRRHL